MENEKVARIKYVMDDAGNEWLRIELKIGQNWYWSFDTAYPLVAQEFGMSKDFLHYGIIKHILHLIDLGYKIDTRIAE